MQTYNHPKNYLPLSGTFGQSWEVKGNEMTFRDMNYQLFLQAQAWQKAGNPVATGMQQAIYCVL